MSRAEENSASVDAVWCGIDAGRVNYELRDVGILLAPGAGMRPENLLEMRIR